MLPYNLESFLEHFCQFKIHNVNLALSIFRDYNKLSKEEFVYILSKWFDDLKDQGNSELLLVKSNCISNSCCKKGCEVFVFAGDKTKEYIAFNFDMFQNRVINITECKTFNFEPFPEMKLVTLEKYTNDDWRPTSGSSQLVRELYPHLDFIPDVHRVSYWLEKLEYYEIYGLSNPKFEEIITCMKNYFRLMNAAEEVEYAMLKLKRVNKDQEAEVLTWFMTYEKIYYDSYLSSEFTGLVSQPDNVVTFLNRYKIDISKIKLVSEFHKLYYYGYEDALI